MKTGDDERPMTLEERMELFSDTLHFFLNPAPSICSLDVICDALGLQPERIRSWIRKALDQGKIDAPHRRRLTADLIISILARLAGGESSTRIGASFGIDPATVRKVRIRARRRAAIAVG